MTTIIAVDPGIVRCGIAVLTDGKVVHAEVCGPKEVRARLELWPVSKSQKLHADLHIEEPEFGYVPAHRCAQVMELVWLCGKLEAWFPDAAWTYRKDVLAALRVPAGRGSADAYLRSEMERRFGDLFYRGKLGPRRNRKAHGADCPTCNGSGYSHQPGRLTHIPAKARADVIDAIALGLAVLEKR